MLTSTPRISSNESSGGGGGGNINGDLAVTGNITQGDGVLVPKYLYLNTPILSAATFAASTNYPFFVTNFQGDAFYIVGMYCAYTAAAGAAAGFQVEVANIGVAPGSGSIQNSIPLPLNGTPNRVQSAIIDTPTLLNPAGGVTSINFRVGSTTTTSLAGLVITVVLQRELPVA